MTATDLTPRMPPMPPVKKPARPKAAAPDELPSLRFRAKLTRNPNATGSWTWIDIPERVSRAFAPWAKAGHVRVDVTFNGVAVQGSFMPRGGGRHLMLLSAAMRRETALAYGDSVEVVATPRVTDEVRLPDDLAAALDAEGNRTASAPITITVGTTLAVTYVFGFNASPDHATNVDAYRLNIYAANANPTTATPLATSDLGKPAPDAQGQIAVDRTSFVLSMPAGAYLATVSAVNASGAAQSGSISLTR